MSVIVFIFQFIDFFKQICCFSGFDYFAFFMSGCFIADHKVLMFLIVKGHSILLFTAITIVNSYRFFFNKTISYLDIAGTFKILKNFLRCVFKDYYKWFNVIRKLICHFRPFFFRSNL